MGAYDAILTEICRDVMTAVEAEAQRFADALESWLGDLWNDMPRTGWREDLDRFIAHWAAQGIVAEPDDVRDLKAWITGFEQEAIAGRQTIDALGALVNVPGDRSTDRDVRLVLAAFSPRAEPPVIPKATKGLKDPPVRRSPATTGPDPLIAQLSESEQTSQPQVDHESAADAYASALISLRGIEEQVRKNISLLRADPSIKGRIVAKSLFGRVIRSHDYEWLTALDYLSKVLDQLSPLFEQAFLAVRGLHDKASPQNQAELESAIPKLSVILLATFAYTGLIHVAIAGASGQIPNGFESTKAAITRADSLYVLIEATREKTTVDATAAGKTIEDSFRWVDSVARAAHDNAVLWKVAKALAVTRFVQGVGALGVFAFGGGFSIPALRAGIVITGTRQYQIVLLTGRLIVLTPAEAAKLAELIAAGAIPAGVMFAKAVDPKGLGPIGESQVPGPQNTARIDSATRRAEYRVPDRLNEVTIEEIKNALNIEFRSQLRDYLAYAKATNRTFILWVRGNAAGAQTRLVGELLELQRKGIIIVRAIPGTGAWIPPP